MACVGAAVAGPILGRSLKGDRLQAMHDAAILRNGPVPSIPSPPVELPYIDTTTPPSISERCRYLVTIDGIPIRGQVRAASASDGWVDVLMMIGQDENSPTHPDAVMWRIPRFQIVDGKPRVKRFYGHVEIKLK
jgi:hypothetical protein